MGTNILVIPNTGQHEYLRTSIGAKILKHLAACPDVQLTAADELDPSDDFAKCAVTED